MKMLIVSESDQNYKNGVVSNKLTLELGSVSGRELTDTWQGVQHRGSLHIIVVSQVPSPYIYLLRLKTASTNMT
jgi:hypothetical protein